MKKKPKSFCSKSRFFVLLLGFLAIIVAIAIYKYNSELYDFIIIHFNIDLENGIKCYENKRNGKCFGLGEEFINNTIKYCGNFKNDIYNNEGILCDGLISCCKVNKRENTFNIRNERHIVYNGRFNKNGKYHNEGELYKNGVVNYCGNFKNGKKNGKNGALCLENKKCCTIDDDNEIFILDNENLRYYGEFEDDQFNGNGTLYENGELIIGMFKNGKLINLINNLKTEKHEEKVFTNLNDFLKYSIINIKLKFYDFISVKLSTIIIISLTMRINLFIKNKYKYCCFVKLI